MIILQLVQKFYPLNLLRVTIILKWNVIIPWLCLPSLEGKKHLHKPYNLDSDRDILKHPYPLDYIKFCDHLALVLNNSTNDASAGWIDARKKKEKEDPLRSTR